ncbi:MAG: hypothetical protein ACO2ON_04190 [Candidatus Nanopusillus sp.]
MVSAIPSKREISFIARDIEMDRIQAVFTELKLITSLKKAELYGKALLWIAENEIAKKKFIEYLLNEKAKKQQLVIIK